MTARSVVLAAFTAAVALAQTTPPADQPTASISGVIRDKVTKQPLRDFKVSTYAAGRDVVSITDPSGHYTLSALPPGRYRVDALAKERFLSQATRMVLVAGQNLQNIDLEIPVDGTVSGRILDDNKEPIPGALIFVVSREYYLGSAGYYPTFPSGQSDDEGHYTIAQIPAGQPFYLVAVKRPRRLLAISEVPLNPQFRRRVAMRTWYPNSPNADGAAALTLRPGETREATDIEMKRSPSYCIDGIISGPNGGQTMFTVEELQPSSGSNSHGGSYFNTPSGKTGEDGKFRICDLSPGLYRLQMQSADRHGDVPVTFGVNELVVREEDQHNLKLITSPGSKLETEVVWDVAPEKPPKVNVTINMQPILRTGFPGSDDWDGKKTEIPGNVSFDNLFLDTYAINARVNSRGLYIKDMSYAGRSVQYDPFRWGSAMQGTGLRVVIGHDGGTIATHVADKDGNPIADARIYLFPVEADTEGTIAARLVNGQTDQTGNFTTRTIAPGKYYVLATDEEYDATVPRAHKLWLSRTNLKVVELTPSGSSQVNLEVVRLM
jgi:protocatechuate 3,4-dioxygenase beta subunit